MQNKQTPYSSKELFCFYMSNHVRLASIMRNCALLIILLIISRNFGDVEAVYENTTASKVSATTSPSFQEKRYAPLLPKTTINTHNIQVQPFYEAAENKILLNVTWEKPLDWDLIHSYNFKVFSNSTHCLNKSFEIVQLDKTSTNILLPPPSHQSFKITPECAYKIRRIINRSDFTNSTSDIIYTVPRCVDEKCLCSPKLMPQIKNFRVEEVYPGKLNISWEINRTGGNAKVYNITDRIFEYRLSVPNQFNNNTFRKLMTPSYFNERNNYFLLDNVGIFVLNKPYELRAIWNNSYNCKIYNFTSFTVTAVKTREDITEEISENKMKFNKEAASPLVQETPNTTLSPRKMAPFENNTKISARSGDKGQDVKVEAVYNAERNKIVLNVTWNKPKDLELTDPYDFEVTPNSGKPHCAHEHKSFKTLKKEKTLTNILLPPLYHVYEIIPGCTYNVSVIINRRGLAKSTSRVVYTVPECVGKKCACAELTPQFTSFQALEFSPGQLNISWEINQTGTNDKVYDITDKTFWYRPLDMLEQPHNSPFRKLVLNLTTDFSQGVSYFVLNDNDAHIFSTDKDYQLQAIFNNTYNCKLYGYTNFTVTAAKIQEDAKQTNSSWVQIMVFLVFSSFLILTVIYILRRNRLVIKEILLNPLSLQFSRQRRRRSEVRTSYIMVPTITKRQQETNLLYVDKEIIDGSVDRYEFPRSRISPRIRDIGKGAFGQVFLAKAFGIEQQPGYTYVAVKTLRERAPPEEMDDFLSEIEILKKVGEHPNIVKIFGCCILKEPYLMVMEYVPCGDLKNYLLELRNNWKRKRTRNDSTPVFSDTSDGAYVLPDSPISRTPCEGRPSVTETECTSLYSEGLPSPTEPFNNSVERNLDHTELQNFALQIARGMEHLEKIPIAHRDLAARNILINEERTLKISDFGLSRVGPYVNSRTNKLPLRWVSLEAIEDHFYDSKGDVWSYAVVLWEIGTLGAFPYEDIVDAMVPPYLASGKRLPRPEICTDELYALMLRCWSRDPQLRPSFQELVELLDVKKRRVYVDFNQLNPLYVFPPSKTKFDDL